MKSEKLHVRFPRMLLGPERGTQTLEGVPFRPHPVPLPSFLHSFIRPPSVLCAEPILGVGCRGHFWVGGVQGYRGGRERGEGSQGAGRPGGGPCGETPVPLGTAAPVVGCEDVRRGSLK